jgi:hypothetical protein
MTQTSERFPSRTLCKKVQGTIRIKYEPAEMSNRLLTGHFHLKGHFKLGPANNPTCEKCQKKDGTTSHVLCDCETFINLRLSSGTSFYRTRLLLKDTPFSKILHFI